MPQTVIEEEAVGETTRGWMIPFTATILAMMALQMSNLGSSPLLKEAQKEFKMSASLYGTFTGMYGLSALLLSVPGGMLAKRFGEKKVMTAGLLMVASAWSCSAGSGAFRPLLPDAPSSCWVTGRLSCVS